jgi:hypothetical protein
MSSLTELQHVVIATAGWLLAFGALFTKFRWGGEFARAKDEVIRAKEAERNLSTRMRQRFRES